jgi:hypothetical protein
MELRTGANAQVSTSGRRFGTRRFLLLTCCAEDGTNIICVKLKTISEYAYIVLATYETGQCDIAK